MTQAEVQQYLNSLAKPPGSLGRLEALAAQLCLVQQTLDPHTTPRRCVLFAADHGVVQAGVSAWPSEVTGLMIRTIVNGKSASAKLADATNTHLRVVDVGSQSEALPPQSNYRFEKVRAGTRNLALEPALTEAEFQQAFTIGQDEANLARVAGCRLVITGEMGIGNTTSASCLTALVTGATVEQVVGRGAGADDATLARKRLVVAAALELHKQLPEAAQIPALCGLEIAAMAGLMHRAAECKLTIVLDGFVATAAALILFRQAPNAMKQIIAAHQSAEPGHALALAHLGLVPILDNWGMRLGEGTGALTMLPLLDAASAILRMATLGDVIPS
jgi:nicotinate-nucleotide--dimethylbenzimidazole phosphoribosyltransferase